MKICLAQTKPVTGDITANINRHQKLAALAAASGCGFIIFPELSLTGYEPTLASALATKPGDDRFDSFQVLSDKHTITIAVGVPLQTEKGTAISLLLFQPHQRRQTYSKQYLHPDEEPFFTRGDSKAGLVEAKAKLALAICYELSIPEHAENAYKNGAACYLASVAKSVEGVAKAGERLAQIAKEYAMPVFMVNCIGLNDGMACAGGSAAWNNKGELMVQLDDGREGLLLVDSETGESTKRYFAP